MRILALIVVVSASVCGQNLQWPDVLSLAPPALEGGLLNPVEFTTNQTLYAKTFSNQNQLSLRLETDAYLLSQKIIYSVERDGWLGSINHFNDLRGRALLKRDRGIDYVGLEWAPLTSYHSQTDGNIFQTLIDVGPVVRFSPYDIPVEIHGGLSAIAWNTKLPTFRQMVTTDLNDTLGIYGGLDIGKKKSRLGTLPLYFDGSIQGRAVEGAREIKGHAGLLFATRIQSGDSLFAFVGDTVSDGNDAFLSQGFDQWGGYVNNPHTIENSFNFQTGVKGIQRNGLTPAFHYGFKQYSLRYPSDKNLLNDTRHREHGITLSLLSSKLFSVNYAGNILFSWEEDDKLYNYESVDEDAEKIVDIRDYKVFATEMNHSVSRMWENGLGFDYSVHLTRYLREYPVVHITRSGPKQSDDDYDEVVRKHGLTLSVLPFEKVDLNLTGTYAINYLYLLKAEQSDRSYIDRRYEIGIHSKIQPMDILTIEPKVTVSTDQREYKFKLNRGRFPEFSRSIYSELSCRWEISDSWSLSGQWTRNDWDNGYWDAAVYRDTIVDTMVRDDYYAIQYKSTDQKLLISSNLRLNEHFILIGGCELRDVFFREFKNGEYLANDLGAGYFAGPFVRMKVTVPKPAYLGKSITLNGHISRSIDDIANDFWDISFTLESVF